MGSSNLEILNGVLNLLYMFSKRSNFIPRLHQDSKSALLKYLMYLAEVSEFLKKFQMLYGRVSNLFFLFCRVGVVAKMVSD